MTAILRKLTLVAFALPVAACSPNEGSPNVPASAQAPFEAATHGRNGPPSPACAPTRVGAARCGVLVERAGSNVAGYGPADLQAAYDLPSQSYGTGQIVAVVDAYDNPNALGDNAGYRSQFGLPSAPLVKFNQKGEQGNYPPGNTGWGLQIDADTEMVTASCPRCTIYIVEANTSNWSDVQQAEAQAVKLGATTVSSSFSGKGAQQKYFDRKGVTYLASSGNFADAPDPAGFPSVVAVGGTTLQRGGGTRGWSERAWAGSAGGCTSYPKPKWQHDSQCAGRIANDVAAVADPSTGVAVFDTFGSSGWVVLGGTAIATPFVAGVFGLAGNANHQDGGRTFWQPAHHAFLYRVRHAGKGRYSEISGWGSPHGIGAF